MQQASVLQSPLRSCHLVQAQDPSVCGVCVCFCVCVCVPLCVRACTRVCVRMRVSEREHASVCLCVYVCLSIRTAVLVFCIATIPIQYSAP